MGYEKNVFWDKVFCSYPNKGNNHGLKAVDNKEKVLPTMTHLQRKLLTFLAAGFMLLLLPTATALAEGKAPPNPDSKFTIEDISRSSESCLPNDTSPGNEFFAHVIITHEASKNIQVAATLETIEGTEVTYTSPEIRMKDSEEEHVGLAMRAVLKPEWKGLLAIGPWTWASFDFYEEGYKIGEASGLFELCSEAPGNHPPAIKTVSTATTQSGQSILINVLTHANDPDGNALEVVGVTQPSVVRGYSNDPHNGRVFIEDNQIRYTPPHETRDYEVSFLYFISDGKGGWAEGAVVVEVLEGAATKPPSVYESIPPKYEEWYGPEEYIGEGYFTEYAVPTKPAKQTPKKGTTPYDFTLSKKAHMSHGSISVTVTCHRTAKCASNLNLKLGKQTVGVAKFNVGLGRHTIAVKLTKAAVKSLAKAKVSKLRAVVSASCCKKTTLTLEVDR